MIKNISLNVILYITVAILLIYSGASYLREGRKGIGYLTMVVAALTIWQGLENAKDIQNGTM